MSGGQENAAITYITEMNTSFNLLSLEHGDCLYWEELSQRKRAWDLETHRLENGVGLFCDFVLTTWLLKLSDHVAITDPFSSEISF